MSRALHICRIFSLMVLGISYAALAGAQTFSVLHNFTGGFDGYYPAASLILDRGGRLYGSTYLGGIYNHNCVQGGCGVVFRMADSGSGWTLNPLYSFPGTAINGISPYAPLVFGPDGSIYGTTDNGGGPRCFEGCGTVFRLTPPSSPCHTVVCPWTETVIYQFQGGTDGATPSHSGVIFDSAGNIYGTTSLGGANSQGTVYKLARTGNNWTETIIHNFVGSGDGANPETGVIMDAAGNLYGTARQGGDLNCNPILGCGTVFELSPSGSNWIETTLYTFENDDVGLTPGTGLTFDASGNLFGSAAGGASGFNGTIFELQKSNGWAPVVLYSFRGHGGATGSLVMDAAGNIYGATDGSGTHFEGSVFELAKQGSGWQFIDLHDFHIDDGWGPVGGVLLDANGNLYGTTAQGGTGTCFNGCGVVYKLAR